MFELLGGRHQLRRGPGNDAGQRAGGNTDTCKAASVDFLQISFVKSLPTVRAGLRGAKPSTAGPVYGR